MTMSEARFEKLSLVTNIHEYGTKVIHLHMRRLLGNRALLKSDRHYSDQP